MIRRKHLLWLLYLLIFLFAGRLYVGLVRVYDIKIKDGNETKTVYKFEDGLLSAAKIMPLSERIGSNESGISESENESVANSSSMSTSTLDQDKLLHDIFGGANKFTVISNSTKYKIDGRYNQTKSNTSFLLFRKWMEFGRKISNDSERYESSEFAATADVDEERRRNLQSIGHIFRGVQLKLQDSQETVEIASVQVTAKVTNILCYDFQANDFMVQLDANIHTLSTGHYAGVIDLSYDTYNIIAIVSPIEPFNVNTYDALKAGTFLDPDKDILPCLIFDVASSEGNDNSEFRIIDEDRLNVTVISLGNTEKKNDIVGTESSSVSSSTNHLVSHIVDGSVEMAIKKSLKISLTEENCPALKFGYLMLDYRDFFLTPEEAIKLGGSGKRPFGDIGQHLYLQIKDVLKPEGGTKMVRLNRIVREKTELQSGQPGTFSLLQSLAISTDHFDQTRRIFADLLSSKFELSLMSTSISGIDTISAPTYLGKPTNHPNIIENSVLFGSAVALNLSSLMVLDGPFSIYNDFDFALIVDQIEVNNSIEANLPVTYFNQISLDDLENLYCWMSLVTIPTNVLSGIGHVDETHRGLFFTNFSVKTVNLRPQIECRNCTSQSLDNGLPFLIQILEEGDVLKTWARRVEEFVQELMLSNLTMVIDKVLIESSRYCPGRPEYNNTLNSTQDLLQRLPQFIPYAMPPISAKAIDSIIFSTGIIIEVAFIVMAELLEDAKEQYDELQTDPLSAQNNYIAPNGTDIIDLTDLLSQGGSSQFAGYFIREFRNYVVSEGPTKDDVPLNQIFTDFLDLDNGAFNVPLSLIESTLNSTFSYSFAGLEVRLNSLSISGLNTFTYFDLLNAIGTQTMENSVRLERVGLSFNASLDHLETMDPPQEVAVSFEVADMNVSMPLFAAIKKNVLDQLPIGSLLLVEEIFPCVMTAVDKMEFTQMLLSFDEKVNITLDGLMEDTSEAMTKSIQVMYEIIPSKLKEVIPFLFDTIIRLTANAFLKWSIINARCEDPGIGGVTGIGGANKYVDFREFLAFPKKIPFAKYLPILETLGIPIFELSSNSSFWSVLLAGNAQLAEFADNNKQLIDEAKEDEGKSAASCESLYQCTPYGDIVAFVKSIANTLLFEPNDAGFPNINGAIIEPATKTISGTPGALFFNQTIFESKVPLKGDSIQFAFANVSFLNLDSFGSPFKLFELPKNASSMFTLVNNYTVGAVPDKPFQIFFDFWFKLVFGGVIEANYLQIEWTIYNAQVDFAIQSRIRAKDLLNYQIQYLVDVGCLAQIFAPYSAEYYQPLFNLRFNMTFDKVRLKMTCNDCESKILQSLPRLLLELENVTDVILPRFADVTVELFESFMNDGVLDKELLESSVECSRTDIEDFDEIKAYVERIINITNGTQSDDVELTTNFTYRTQTDTNFTKQPQIDEYQYPMGIARLSIKALETMSFLSYLVFRIAMMHFAEVHSNSTVFEQPLTYEEAKLPIYDRKWKNTTYVNETDTNKFVLGASEYPSVQPSTFLFMSDFSSEIPSFQPSDVPQIKQNATLSYSHTPSQSLAPSIPSIEHLHLMDLSAIDPFLNQMNKLLSSKVPLSDGTYDLFVNILLRKVLGSEPFVTPFNDTYAVNAFIVEISELRLKGMDSFFVFNPVYDIVDQSFQSELGWKRIDMEMEVIAKATGPLSDEISEDDSIPLVLTASVENVTLSQKYSMELNGTKLGALPLASALNLSSYVSCLDEIKYNNSDNTLRAQEFRLEAANMSLLDVKGFRSNELIEAAEEVKHIFAALNKDDDGNDMLLQALPGLFDIVIRPFFNTMLERAFQEGSACSFPNYADDKFIDLRDLLLPAGVARFYGGRGDNQYGQLTHILASLIDIAIEPNEKTNLSPVNKILEFFFDLSPISPGKTSSSGFFRFGNLTLYDMSLYDFGSRATLALYDITVGNVYSVGGPTSLFDVTRGLDYNLSSTVTFGAGDRPLRLTFTLLADVVLGKTRIKNDFDISINFHSLSILLDGYLKILERELLKLPLRDIHNVNCWLSMLSLPSCESDGLNKNCIPHGEDEMHSALTHLTLFVGNVDLEMSCHSCTQGFKNLEASLSQKKSFPNLTKSLNNGFESLLRKQKDAINDIIHRSVLKAKRRCPHNPIFFDKDENIWNISKLSPPFTGSKFQVKRPTTKGLYKIIFIAVLPISFLLFIWIAVVRTKVLNGHHESLRKLRMNEYFELKQRERKRELLDIEVNKMNKSFFSSSEIPRTVRYTMPVIIVCNVGLFLMGHICNCFLMKIEVRIAGQKIPQELEFAMLTSIFKLLKIGSKSVGVLVFICAIIWPYAKLLVTLILWFLPPPYLQIATRGSLLLWTQTLSKWSMGDIMVLIVSFVGMKVYISNPSFEFLEFELFSVNISVVPLWGMYANLFAQLLSQASSQIMIYYHNKNVELGKIKFMQQLNENSSGISGETIYELWRYSFIERNNYSTERIIPTQSTNVLTERVIPTQFTNVFIVFLVMFQCVLIVIACALPSVSFDTYGIVRTISEFSQNFQSNGDQYSVFAIAKVSNDAIFFGGYGFVIFAVVLIITTLIAPISHSAIMAYIWFGKSAPTQRKKLLSMAEIFMSLSYSEIYVFGVVIATWQLESNSQLIFNSLCGTFDNFITHLVDEGILEDASNLMGQCFQRAANVGIGAYLIIASFFLQYVFHCFVTMASDQYFCEKDDDYLIHLSLGDQAKLQGQCESEKPEERTLKPFPLLFTDIFRWALRREVDLLWSSYFHKEGRDDVNMLIYHEQPWLELKQSTYEVDVEHEVLD